MAALKRFFAVPLLALLFLLMLAPMGQAVEMPSTEQLEPLTELATESGITIDIWAMIGHLMSGETLTFSDLQQSINDALTGAMGRATGLLSLLLVPAILLAVLREMIGEEEKKVIAAGFVCYLVAALSLMQAFHDAATLAVGLISSVGRWIDTLFPILTAMLVACGATASAAAYAPILSLAAGILSGAINSVSLALCSVAAVIATFGSLSERFSLGKLLNLAKSTLNWIIGLVLTGFLGLISLQTLLASTQDSNAMRAAKYAVGNLIPGVGGEVADTMNAVTGSAILVKNATGVTGLIGLVLTCVEPIVQLLVSLTIIRLASALTEPLAPGPLSKLIDRFSDVFSMLLMAAASAVVIGVTLLGAVLATGNAAIVP